jgi:Tol biopolymer transport system component
VEGVQRPRGVAAAGANYAVSDQGTLAYVSGAAVLRSLVWVNRKGTAPEPINTIPPDEYEDPRLSPDGTRVLVTRDGDIWIYDIASGRTSRATRDGVSLMGVWDPTGAQVAYSSGRGGNLEAWVVPADGSAEPRQLTTLGGQIHVDSWSPDGRLLTLHRHAPEGGVDIFVVPMDQADRKPRLFVEGLVVAEGADFSPDMRYVAYLSPESGRREIYVRPYPGPGGQVTVSVGGGREPIWSANGEVFYRSLTGDRMFAVSITTTPTLTVGSPVELFQRPYYISPTGSPRPQYDITADGQRLVMLAPGPGLTSTLGGSRIVVVQNWREELKRLVPVN